MPNEPLSNVLNDGSFYFPYSGNRYVLRMDINLPADSLQELLEATNKQKLLKETNSTPTPTPTPTKIIRSGPVTVIFWEDKTKTLVRRAEGVQDDPYLAFCAGLAKKIYGNNSKVKKLIEEKTVETKEKEKKTND